MERHPLRAPCRAASLLLVLTVGPAPAGEQGARPKPAPDRPAQERIGEKAGEKAAADKAAPVIGCPSLANLRMLMRGGAAAAAATLADPKADHLGCAALPRARITGIADHVALGGQSYDCAAVQGTTACHWTGTGTLPAAADGRPPRPGTGAP